MAGKLKGKNLHVVSGKQIIELWRATHGKKKDYSVLILNFTRPAGRALIDLIQFGVPTYDHQGVGKGWSKYYGRPWKKYLQQAK